MPCDKKPKRSFLPNSAADVQAQHFQRPLGSRPLPANQAKQNRAAPALFIHFPPPEIPQKRLRTCFCASRRLTRPPNRPQWRIVPLNRFVDGKKRLQNSQKPAGGRPRRPSPARQVNKGHKFRSRVDIPLSFRILRFSTNKKKPPASFCRSANPSRFPAPRLR